ncbi:hypothetical protein FB451DRAFT_242633 [Mycena latifolia]|nr:hypothetical protein FB451DRAFT_242633 [Mycena latifolia]
MYPRMGMSQTIPNHRARGGTAQGGTTQSAKALTLSDLHALIVKLEARMAAQEKKIAALEHENSDLWQEIHRVSRNGLSTFPVFTAYPQLKGPRLPLEICFLIVNSARDDKKALKTFSLVCKSWMLITRKILFARISHSAMFWLVKVDPVPILNNPHCTVFPHVEVIDINGSTDDGSDAPVFLSPTWLEDFLHHMPKFTALTSLDLFTLDQWDFEAIDRTMPPAMKRGIRGLDIYRPRGLTMSTIAAFVSNFTELTTLECGEMYGGWEDDALTDLLGTNEALVPPPSSITKLVMCETGHLPSTILKWFTDLHSGVIESLNPNDLPTSHPVQFRAFIDRFGASLSEIRLSMSDDDTAVQLLESRYISALTQLKSIVLDLWKDILVHFPTILAQLPPSIEAISLLIDPNKFPYELVRSQMNWSQLDRTLVGTKFPSLRCLTILIRHFCREDEEKLLTEMWSKLLPRFAQKQFLTIKFTSF